MREEQQLYLLGEADFEDVWKIMEASFPPEERREKEKQRKLLREEEKYRLFGGFRDGKLNGFLAAWQFPDFHFVEHFAVESSERGSGFGQRMLEMVMQKAGGRIVLEVEPPEDEKKKRRIGFYERNGFVLNDYPYIQPAMAETTEPIPLMVMSTGGSLTEEEFSEIRRQLYHSVYLQKNI